jgi:hypothetical protein
LATRPSQHALGNRRSSIDNQPFRAHFEGMFARASLVPPCTGRS